MDPSVWLYTLAAVAVVSLMSLIGAAAGLRWFTRHSVVLTLVAVAAGALLGDALLHLLPEASELWGGFPLAMAVLVIGGFLVFFFLETVLRFGHAHGELALDDPHEHHPHHERAHAHSPSPAGMAKTPAPGASAVKPFGWMNLAGDGLHNFIDGVIIAAAFSTGDPALGIATAVAVALHEIPQELGDFAVLLRAGFSARKALWLNFASALTSVAGALLFLLLPFDSETLEKYALPVTAGGFLYIAAADLIPELHHHTGDRHSGLIVAGLLAGLAIMAALLLVG